MQHDFYDDSYLAGILGEVGTIALVGASNKEDRPSYRVMKYMQTHGYRVIPVNPGMAGQTILGETVHASLDDIPGPYEMVDVFRNSEAAASVSDEAVRIARAKGIKVVWMQLDVRNDDAAARAEQAGIKVVMNRCPKIELARLGLEK
ncbi:MAG: CoA-binding protein [Alphaproteobacteria bacterium]|nr:CoA-binding protein [Alphaproteobacteria bacterium]